MQSALQKYLNCFKRLKRGVTKYGKAPHKPLMLLCVLQAVRNKLITQNQIFITPELVVLFKSNWNALVTTQHVCNFALPFWHLRGEKIWHLIPKPGFEASIKLKESVSSLGELNAVIEFAKLDEDLFVLMKNKEHNLLLQQFLLDEYFPERDNYPINSLREEKNLFSEIESKILHEPAEDYRREIKKLLSENNEEEIYIRGSLFKREIPKIYNNTCCISGMKIDATISVSMVDACHIVPFSESYDDTITNGIALCPNLHRAFDRGLIGIDENYRVVVSNSFSEVGSEYSIKQFKSKIIQFPLNRKYYPRLKNLRWHFENIFKS